MFSIVNLINNELQFPNGVRFASRNGSGGLREGLMVLERSDAGDWWLSLIFLGMYMLNPLSS